jgi:hypothetical protein
LFSTPGRNIGSILVAGFLSSLIDWTRLQEGDGADNSKNVLAESLRDIIRQEKHEI